MITVILMVDGFLVSVLGATLPSYWCVVGGIVAMFASIVTMQFEFPKERE